MKSLIGLVTLALSLNAHATLQSELSLSPKCKAVVEKAVTRKLGRGDETFSIVGMKLLYGGSLNGLHFSPVLLVTTSDEVEPRQAVVITSWVSSEYAAAQGCKVVQIHTVADGSVIDDPAFEN